MNQSAAHSGNVSVNTITKPKSTAITTRQPSARVESSRSRQAEHQGLAMKDTDRGMNIMSDAPHRKPVSQNSSPASTQPDSASVAASQLFDELMLTAWQSLPDAASHEVSATGSPARTASASEAIAATMSKIGAAALAAELSKPSVAVTKASASTATKTFQPSSTPRTDSSSSDDEVLRRVADCLAARDIASFTRIGVDVRRGVITIRGDVASKGERLLLLHLLRKIPGVEQINDGLSITSARPVAAVRASRRESVSFSWPRLSDGMPAIDFQRSTAAVLLAGAVAFWFWPSGPSHPVAVHPVKGKAVMEGTPMAGAHLVLYPDPDSKIPAGITSRGTVADDGSFELSTFNHKDGAPSGEFVVTVVWSKPVIVDGETQSGPSLVSAVYSKPDSSPLRIKIAVDTKELQPLELKKLNTQAQVVPQVRSSSEHE